MKSLHILKYNYKIARTNQTFGTEEAVLRFGGGAYYYEEPLFPAKEKYLRHNLKYPLTVVKQR